MKNQIRKKQSKKMKLKKNDKTNIIPMPACGHYIAPLVYVIPMQLLSYYVAINKKTNMLSTARDFSIK